MVLRITHDYGPTETQRQFAFLNETLLVSVAFIRWSLRHGQDGRTHSSKSLNTFVLSGCASAGDSKTHCQGDTSGKLTRKREKRTYQPTDGTSEKERSTALELNIYHYVDN